MLSRATASLAKQNALLGQLPSVPSYLGQVATGCYCPDTLTASRTQFNSRSPHFARDTITTLKIALPGFYLGQNGLGETAIGANTTYTASIEYPAGTFTQVLFSGSATGTATNGSLLVSDFCTVSIPNGALFWVRVFFTNASGMVTSFNGLNTGCGAAFSYAASGLSDQTMSGTITNTNAGTAGGLYQAANAACFSPIAIIAQTTKPSFYVLGDSRGKGSHDAWIGANCDQGNIGRSIGPFAAYINGSVSGDTLSGFVASHTNRLILAGYASAIVLELGINDVNAGTSIATMQGYYNTIRGYFGVGTPVYLTTMEPMATCATVAVSSLTSSGIVCTATCASTSALSIGQIVNIAGASPTTYNTTAAITAIPSATTFTYNVAAAPASSPATGSPTYQDCCTAPATQTTIANNANRVTLDTWKRGVPAGFKACLELSDPVEAGRGSGLWTQQFGSASQDGTHGWPAIYLAQKASGAISSATLL